MTPRGLTACVLLSGLLSAGQATAASNLLIWPIDPFFAPDDNAAELWLQNQGDQATTMQVRIVRWRQENGNERYEQQQEVVASPPIVRVEGGTKQLIRLIKQTTVPAGIEQAYRIVVDEIPQPDGNNNPQIGLKLQMRYSIPLFVYGQGIATQRSGTHHAFVNPADLSWRVVNEGGQRAVQVTNRGDIHVRLSNVSVTQGGQRREMAQGLLGYVLPHSTRAFPLPAGTPGPNQLTASINARNAQWQTAPAP